MNDDLPESISVDGYVDNQGVLYVGNAVRQPDGTYIALADVNGTLLFTARDGAANHGNELWQSDGTADGSARARPTLSSNKSLIRLCSRLNPSNGSHLTSSIIPLLFRVFIKMRET